MEYVEDPMVPPNHPGYVLNKTTWKDLKVAADWSTLEGDLDDLGNALALEEQISILEGAQK